MTGVNTMPTSDEYVDEYNPNALGERVDACLFCLAQAPHRPTDKCEVPTEEPSDIQSIADVINNLGNDEPATIGRPQIANGADMKDPISTGRKRAALALPIMPGMVCEWAYLKSAGGGPEPIIGCIGYPASDRHHGPNKATLDNTTMENPADDGTWNLHAICDMCHNRWHAANDKYYDEPRPRENTVWLPNVEYKLHNPVDKLSKTEVMMLEATRGQTIGD